MWLAIASGPDEIHLIPHNDLIEHTENDECICGPATTHPDDGLKVVAHASLDGRELNDPNWER